MSVASTGAAPVVRGRTRPPPNVAGNGLVWDEDAVARHLATR